MRPGQKRQKEIVIDARNYQLSVDRLVDEVGLAVDLGVRAFIFFGIPTSKDPQGAISWHDQGIVQQALRALRPAFKDILLITDECFCEYTDHGHCGVLSEHGGRMDVDNDATLPNLARQCVSHVQAGADIVAPSGMMDGMVAAIRKGLDDAGYNNIPIMSTPPNTSGFYGPFRDAAESPPSFGDRSTYQMDPANSNEAIARFSSISTRPTSSWLPGVVVPRHHSPRQDRSGPAGRVQRPGEFAMVAAAAKGWIERARGDGDFDEHQRGGHDPDITRWTRRWPAYIMSSFSPMRPTRGANEDGERMLVGKDSALHRRQRAGSAAMGTVFRQVQEKRQSRRHRSCRSPSAP